MADGGWVSMSEAARLYGKHRKWVYDQCERYGITRKKSDTDNKVLLPLADLIAHRGEPPNMPDNGTPKTTGNHTASYTRRDIAVGAGDSVSTGADSDARSGQNGTGGTAGTHY